MQGVFDSIDFLAAVKAENPDASKAILQSAFVKKFSPTKCRSVFVSDGFAFRFSEARTGSFSNTVLSLSALRAHDHRPFIVAVNRPDRVDFLMANTTFLRKISHSSLELRTDNIKGSFNGTDVMSEYENLPNEPQNFEQLFALHAAFTWDENVERLVEATNEIVARDSRFKPSEEDRGIILSAPERALAALADPQFFQAEQELSGSVAAKHQEILDAAQIDNVNLRGNAIEQLLTQADNAHELGDIDRPLGDGRLVIDIKTKLLGRASAPKAYSIDKMLSFLAEPGSVFAFYMIGVDATNGRISARLLPIFECSLLDATGIQHHWSGRGSRGVTQLSGQYSQASAPDYEPKIDLEAARSFLGQLLEL